MAPALVLFPRKEMDCVYAASSQATRHFRLYHDVWAPSGTFEILLNCFAISLEVPWVSVGSSFPLELVDFRGFSGLHNASHKIRPRHSVRIPEAWRI